MNIIQITFTDHTTMDANKIELTKLGDVSINDTIIVSVDIIKDIKIIWFVPIVTLPKPD